jgi:hypothetical protein
MTRLLDLELPEAGGSLPSSAGDITTDDLVALAWGHVTPNVAGLTVSELKDVTDALRAAYDGVFSGGEVAEAGGCCCCCCPCCCCSTQILQ